MLGMLMSVQMAFAQQNVLLVGSNGSVDAVSVSSVGYATFNANSKWFSFTNDSIEPSRTSITASCTVSLAADVKKLGVTPEVGVCYSKDNTTPTIDDSCKVLGSELKSYTFTLSPLNYGTTYYFRMYVKLTSGVFYGDVAKTKTLDNSKTIYGYKFVDLGLPSGLLWAEKNVGADEVFDDGKYYAWGETSSKGSYSEDTYFDKDCTTYSIGGKTTLEKQHDAAYINLGDSCRMPTNDEFAELLNPEYCTWEWTTVPTHSSSRFGYKVTSVKYGTSIFLLTSGYRENGNTKYRQERGYYWSSTLDSERANYACLLFFSDSRGSQEVLNRYYGYSVRAVAEP